MAELNNTPDFNHEGIRATGESMARIIGALANKEIGHSSAVDSLNDAMDYIPYTELLAEQTRLEDSIGAFTAQSEEIDNELATEITRLNGLVQTFASKKSNQLAAAKALAEQKKREAQTAADAKKALFAEPLGQLEAQYGQLSETLSSIPDAWPLPEPSPEVLEAVARRMAELEEESDDSTANRFRSERPTPLLPELDKRVLGPYAELANSIPTLSDRLRPAVSVHEHVYGEIETAKDVYDRAIKKAPAERDDEENILLASVYILKSRFLQNPNDIKFLSVYTPADILKLSQALRKFSKKNRPDFEDLEGQILDKAATYVSLLGKEVPQDIQDAAARMESDKQGRRGMQWNSLSKHAERACTTMRARLFAGGAKNTHLKSYVVEVVDRSGKSPDLSWVYQFVADNFTFDILEKRLTKQQANTKERFIENVAIIEKWLDESRELIDQLPNKFRLRRYNAGRRNYRKRDKTAEYEPVTARTSILNTIEDIKIRLSENGDPKTPRHKPYQLDASGALNHQLRLGHLVDTLKHELEVYDAPTEGRAEEIAPFF